MYLSNEIMNLIHEYQDPTLLMFDQLTSYTIHVPPTHILILTI